MSVDMSRGLGVAAAAKLLADRQASSTELTTDFIARARAHDGLGAFLHLDAELALQQAQAADARRAAAGDAARTVDGALNGALNGVLNGVPIAHKDIFVTEDAPTTAGSRMLQAYQSPFDATVVARLKAAGAVSLGKLNCDEFAMGSANENSAYRKALNPWDTTRVPGGKGDHAVARAHAVGGLDAGDAGKGRRLPDGATGVGACGSCHQTSGHCHSRAARGASRHTRGVPGVERLCLQPGSGRPHGAQRRRLRPDALSHERLR